MNARWLCLDCDLETGDPSFSEGPKTTDPKTGIQSVRFKLSRFLCPFCFSPRLKPVEEIPKIIGATS